MNGSPRDSRYERVPKYIATYNQFAKNAVSSSADGSAETGETAWMGVAKECGGLVAATWRWASRRARDIPERYSVMLSDNDAR